MVWGQGFCPLLRYVDRVSALSSASIWWPRRMAWLPGCVTKDVTGQGGNSSQMSPRWSVVGSHLWIGVVRQPVQYNWTHSFCVLAFCLLHFIPLQNILASLLHDYLYANIVHMYLGLNIIIVTECDSSGEISRGRYVAATLYTPKPYAQSSARLATDPCQNVRSRKFLAFHNVIRLYAILYICNSYNYPI